MADVRIALTGFGNVGQGLATLLAERGSTYQERYGVELLLTAVADRGGASVDDTGLDPRALLQRKESTGTVAAPRAKGRIDLADIFARGKADLLVEAASTNFKDAEPGWSNVQAALAQGMDVVLASKGSLALHFRELMDDAAARGLRVLFSATVGAPVPSLQIAERALIGADITGFEGILNGTTHHILTAMSEGSSYEEGVRQAQAMGIAETDPTLDVEGYDAAAKVAIVANAVFGSNLRIEDVERQGITPVTEAALRDALAAGEVIKLIARARKDGELVTASVATERRARTDALGRLRGDDMGIVFFTEPLGAFAATVEPCGASGGISTAMTVLRDILNLANDRGWSTQPA